MKSQRRKSFAIIILVIVAFAAFLLIPRKRNLKDGGTIRYESLWPLYCVEHRHRIHVENDYDNPMPAGSSPEDTDREENSIESSISE